MNGNFHAFPLFSGKEYIYITPKHTRGTEQIEVFHILASPYSTALKSLN